MPTVDKGAAGKQPPYVGESLYCNMKLHPWMKAWIHEWMPGLCRLPAGSSGGATGTALKVDRSGRVVR